MAEVVTNHRSTDQIQKGGEEEEEEEEEEKTTAKQLKLQSRWALQLDYKSSKNFLLKIGSYDARK